MLISNQWWVRSLSANKAIAVIRATEMELALAMAEAVAAGGIKLIEITWNSDRPDQCISKLRANLPHCTIGAGTILDVTQLHRASVAGAQFIFCPHFDRHLFNTAGDRYNLPLMPGVLSPTEIVTAWQGGANVVKVFPIQAVGGADYLKSLHGPLSQINYIPTGGVTIDNAKTFIDAGAIAVGISGNLFPKHLVESHNWQEITKRTARLLTKIEV
ncbi:MAG: bifunctional 4-hydroxy-2-oxoglutarate aldolase/2-dehydro-3-deoxy-phosphogluconate aldolase [Pleurocapsa sp.]